MSAIRILDLNLCSLTATMTPKFFISQKNYVNLNTVYLSSALDAPKAIKELLTTGARLRRQLAIEFLEHEECLLALAFFRDEAFAIETILKLRQVPVR
jgi:hypothetical protein